MSHPIEDWQRLAECVSQRRAQLGLTQEDVRAAGGPSTVTLRYIESASQDSYKSNSLTRLERALDWAAGSVEAVLAGGEPTERSAAKRPPSNPEGDSEAGEIGDPLAGLPEDPDERLAELVRRNKAIGREIERLVLDGNERSEDRHAG
ncbi:hypothetical protein [Actinomadura harenae]|nr:hypothetical protein [Actinomadura harenae]